MWIFKELKLTHSFMKSVQFREKSSSKGGVQFVGKQMWFSHTGDELFRRRTGWKYPHKHSDNLNLQPHTQVAVVLCFFSFLENMSISELSSCVYTSFTAEAEDGRPHEPAPETETKKWRRAAQTLFQNVWKWSRCGPTSRDFFGDGAQVPYSDRSYTVQSHVRCLDATLDQTASLRLLFHPSNGTSDLWVESVILFGKICKCQWRKLRHETHTCVTKKAVCESCWGPELCRMIVRSQPNTWIFSWFVWLNVFHSLLWNLPDRDWRKGKRRMRGKWWFPLKTPWHVQLYGRMDHVKTYAFIQRPDCLEWSAFSHREWWICAVAAPLWRRRFVHQRLLWGSDTLLKTPRLKEVRAWWLQRDVFSAAINQAGDVGESLFQDLR